MTTAATLPLSAQATPPRVRLVLRDHRVLDARLNLGASTTLAKSLGRDRRFLNLTDAHWLETGERVSHLVLRADRILWVAMCGEAPLVGPCPPGTTLRPAEIGLSDGLTVRAQLVMLEGQRLTDHLHSAGTFLVLREARLAGTGRWLGDVLLNIDEVLTVREVSSIRDASASVSHGSADGASAPPAAPVPPWSSGTPLQRSTAAEAPEAAAVTVVNAPDGSGVEATSPAPAVAARQWLHESLVARIEALQASRAELQRDTPVALEWMRRIAHSLRTSGTLGGFPELAGAARALEQATGAQALDALDRLLSLLQRVLDRTRAERPVVLVVENDPGAARALEARLGAPDRDIVVATTAEEAERFVAERDIALILLDRTLPDRDGLDLLGRLRALHAADTVPIFMLSARTDGVDRAECFAHGADACFEKPLDIELIAAAVESELRPGLRPASMSRRDPLTGLPDRTAFQEAFDQTAALARRAGQPLCMALLDLRGEAGSIDDPAEAAWIRHAAAIVSRGLRPSDLLARLDGGRFGIIFPNTRQRGARIALEKTLEALRPAQESEGAPTALAGLAEFSGTERFEEALEQVGEILFRAGEAGADAVASADDDLAELPVNRILLAESDDILASVIRYRLERDGFDVVHRDDGRAALEALERQRFSLVVAELKLPKLGGFELLERLRRIPAYANVPVVLLTAAPGERDMARGFRLGADDFIVKPVSISDLLARVRRLTGRHAP